MAPSQRRDELESTVRDLVEYWGLKRLCYALADYCYAEARTHLAHQDEWGYLGQLFTLAETHAKASLTRRDNGV